MPVEKNQDDIVNNFMLNLDNNQIVTEDVSFYALRNVFKVPPLTEEVRTESIMVPLLKSRNGAVSYRDLANAFLWLIKSKPGVLSFNWDREKPDMVSFQWSPGFSQEARMNDDDLISLAENIFKSRGNLFAIEWVLGAPSVALTYRLPQTF